MISKILDLPIKDVIDKLWLDYRSKWAGEFGLIDWWKKTDWRSFNVNKNIVTDFSNWRWQWPSFQFVKSYLRQDDWQTYKRFWDNFWLCETNRNEEFYKLPELWETEIKYLSNRKIDYNKIKWQVRKSQGIAIRVFEDDFCEWIIKRNIDWWKQRFSCDTWTNWKAVYQWKLDYSKNYIFIVEWMFDFLSIYQFDHNVVWMRNRELGTNTIFDIISKFKNVYIIPDNDDNWKAMVQKFKKFEPFVFDLKPFEVKDFNDLLVLKDWQNILQEIKEHSQQMFDVFDKRIVPYTRWVETVNNEFGLFDEWDLVVIAGYPWMWKTEFNFFVARENAKKNIQVCYYTLELAPTYIKKRFAMKKAWISKIDWQLGKYTDEQIKKAKNIYKELSSIENLNLVWFETPPTIEQITDDIKEKHKAWCKLFFIDNLWNISWSVNEIERFNDITQKLQSLKNELNICIVILHHMSKPWRENWMWWVWKLRWSQKIIDNATLVLEVWRETDKDEEDYHNKVTKLGLYKDTMWWLTWKIDIYFNEWNYQKDPVNWPAYKTPDLLK